MVVGSGMDDLLQLVPVPLIFVDAAGNARPANAPAREMLSWPASEQSGRLPDLFDGAAGAVQKLVDDALADPARVDPVVVHCGSGEAARSFELTARRVEDEQSPTVLIALHDVTAHETVEQQLEEALAHEGIARASSDQDKQRLETLVAAFSRALTEAQLLNAVAASVAGEANVERILAATLDQLGRVVRFTHGAIALRQGDRLAVQASYEHGTTTATGAWLDGFDVGERAVEQRRGVLAVRHEPGAAPVRSAMAAPLIWRGAAFGAVTVGAPLPDAFSTVDLRLLEKIATQLSGPVELGRRLEMEARAHAAAEEATERYQAVVEGVDGAVWEADPLARRFTFISRRVEAMFGYPVQEWLSLDASSLAWVHADDRAPLWVALDAAVRTGVEQPVEYRVRTADGRDVLIRDNIRYSATEGGALRGLMIDVTAQREADQERLRLAERTRLLLESTREGVYGVDRAGRCIFANSAAAALLGYPSEELLHADIHELVHGRRADGSVYPREACPLWIAMDTGVAQRVDEDVLWRADGTTVPVSLTAAPIVEGGAITGAVVTFSDNTARRLAEERRRFIDEATTALASSLDYETTLASVAQLAVPFIADWCAVHVIDEDDPNGRPRRLAVAHVDPTRVEAARRLQERLPAQQNARFGLPRVLATGRSEFYPYIPDDFWKQTVRDPEMLRIILSVGMRSALIAPMRARGRIVGAVTFIATESGRRFTRDDLALAEELAGRAGMAIDNARLYQQAQDLLAARTEFVSTVSHDLKNPLTTVKGMAQLLQRRASRLNVSEADRARLVEGLEHIDALTTRMTEQLGEFSDVTRIQAGQPLELRRGPIDIVALVRQEVEAVQRSTEKHRLALQADPPCLLGEFDGPRLRRVVANLLSNAVKYSPSGGPVIVSVRREPEEGGDAAVLRVADRGVGIPASDLPHIFTHGRRGGNVIGRIEGTGIGLAGVRQIVEQHGGSVGVESEEGRGTTFTVRLPLSADAE